MTAEEIRIEFTKIFNEARAMLEEKRFFEVSFAVGDGLERARFTRPDKAFQSYRARVATGNRDVAINAKTEKIEFRGASYAPFLLALFKKSEIGPVEWPDQKVRAFNELVMTSLTAIYVGSLGEADARVAIGIRDEMIETLEH
jgi:hypothetical protein